MFWGAAVVVILAVAAEAVAARLRPTGRGLASICIGAGLLAIGVTLHMAGSRRSIVTLPVLENPRARMFVREVVGFYGGTLFVVCGAVWCIAGWSGRRDLRRL